MPHRKRIVTATVVAALAFFATSAHAQSTLEEASTRARQYLQQTMKEQRIPGLQVAVIKDNRIVLSESYGLANVENRVAVTNATLFPINSATKAFTGVAIMQLAEASLVDLDAPVSRYLVDLPEAWRAFGCANCWRTPPGCRTSSTQMAWSAGAPSLTRGRRCSGCRWMRRLESGSLTTRPTTRCYHVSFPSRPECRTSGISPSVSSR